MKTYATKASAKQAINNAGLQLVTHDLRIVKAPGGANKIKPVFICDLDEDVVEIRRRGFEAEKAPTAAEA